MKNDTAAAPLSTPSHIIELLRRHHGVATGDTSRDLEFDALPALDKARDVLIAETGNRVQVDRVMSLLRDCGALGPATAPGAKVQAGVPASGLSALVKNLMGVGDAFSLGIMNGILRHGMDFDAAADHARDMVTRIAKSGASEAYSIDVLSGIVDELYEAARTDKLTGLLMRSAFEKEYVRIQEGSNAIVLIDCDHFKRVNDTHGHDAGDDVLRRVADLIQRGVRAIDHACRWGGDEFVVLLPRAELDDARAVAERLRQVAASADLMGVTLSIGVATTGRHEALADAIQRADKAMYVAKRGGKNSVVVA